MQAYKEAFCQNIEDLARRKITSDSAESLYYWLHESNLSKEEKKLVISRLRAQAINDDSVPERVLEQYESYRSIGLNSKDAALMSGITSYRLQNWLQGKNIDEETHKRLLKIEARANVLCKERCLRTISESIDEGNVRSAMWLLERKYPQEFGIRQSFNIEANQEVEVTHNVNEDRALKARAQLRAFREKREQENGHD